MAPEKIEHSIQLLVEGNDARNFFEALVARMALAGSVQVQNFGGVDELRRFLQAFVKAPGFTNVTGIGIVRDAEGGATEPHGGGAANNPAARAFQSVRGALEHVELPAPPGPMEPAGESPTVRVFVLPGNDEPGMLETLLCRTFADTPEERCVETFLRCAKESGNPVERPDKARAHAWLATRRHPQVSVGVAAQKGYWDFDHQALDGVRQFLASL